MPESWIGFDLYRILCRELGEEDTTAQEQLAGFLHSLGIALNYRDDPRLRDTHVLNPRWVTEGVYRSCNDERLTAAKGELRLAHLGKILDACQYPPERHPFLVELMRKFELCFRFTEEDDRYLVPELLGKEQPPEAESFGPARCLNFEYRYPTVLPEGLLPRFIVRTYAMSDGEPRWRTGVILRFRDSRGLVVADPVARRLRICISGPIATRRELLAVIRTDFERIHASYRSAVEEMVPVPAHPDVLVPYTKLLTLHKAGIREFVEVAGQDVLTLSVRELLEGVDVAPVRPSDKHIRTETRAPRAFISYSHRDERLKDQLDNHLKLLQRQELLEVWHDRQIMAGSDWKGEIDSNLDRADLILLLVSPDFIASEYCYDVEMSRALERHAEGSARVIPVIIRDVAWRIAPFARLQALPKDGRAVTLARSRDTAWRNVAEGIETALKELAKKPGQRHRA